tara:strand:- start:1009 stop:1404 length:396 start_codon:yes stop_codon:yes gene_type:complete
MKDRLKKARKNKGLSQTKLAELIAVTPQSVQQWEDENKNIMPRRDTLTKIAEVLNVSEIWLHGYSNLEHGEDYIHMNNFTDCLESVLNKALHHKNNISAKEVVNITVAVYKLNRSDNREEIIKNMLKLINN